MVRPTHGDEVLAKRKVKVISAARDLGRRHRDRTWDSQVARALCDPQVVGKPHLGNQGISGKSGAHRLLGRLSDSSALWTRQSHNVLVRMPRVRQS